MADSIIKLREQGIDSITQLDDLIKKSADDRQDLLDKIKAVQRLPIFISLYPCYGLSY